MRAGQSSHDRGRRIACALAAALVLGAAFGTAGAADRFWNTSADGNFGDAFNWDDGKQGVPGVDDTAIFDVGADFLVTFLEDATTDRVHVRDGFVTFLIDPAVEYALLNELPTTPGVAVGVGDGDKAILAVEGGMLHGVFTDIGDAADAFGELTIDGAAARLHNDQQLNVANEGLGFLNVTNGALVTNGRGNVGLLPTAYGRATVRGPGSEWSSSQALMIGKGGRGELRVEDGGRVVSADAVIAQAAGSRGATVVRGEDSDWLVHGTLDVAMNGRGSLLIEDGAKVTVDDFATVGTFPGNPEEDPQRDGARGDVVVRDAGSVWAVGGDLYVPFLGEGTLVIESGGVVAVAGDFLPDLLGGGQVPLVFGLAGPDDYPLAAIEILGVVSDDADSPAARVELLEGYAPVEGDTFVLMTAFAGVDLIGLSRPALEPPREWLVTQTSTLLEITVVFAEVCPGDIDASGAVDFDDLLRVLDAWGPCAGCPEDLNGDDEVGFDDLLIVLDNWGPCP